MRTEINILSCKSKRLKNLFHKGLIPFSVSRKEKIAGQQTVEARKKSLCHSYPSSNIACTWTASCPTFILPVRRYTASVRLGNRVSSFVSHSWAPPYHRKFNLFINSLNLRRCFFNNKTSSAHSSSINASESLSDSSSLRIEFKMSFDWSSY